MWRSLGKITIHEPVPLSWKPLSCSAVIFQQVKGNKGDIFIQSSEIVDPQTWDGLLYVLPKSKVGMLPAVDFSDDSSPAPLNLANFWVGAEHLGDSVLVSVRRREGY